MENSLLSDLDALLISDPTNIRYLTGFAGLAPREREAYVLVADNQLLLFTSPLYLEQAKKLLHNVILVSPKGAPGIRNGADPGVAPLPRMTNKLKVIEISHENPLAKNLKQIISHAELGSASPTNKIPKPVRDDKFRLGFEEANVTVAEFNKLKSELKDCELAPTNNRVEELRKIKQPEEINFIRQAARLTDQCFTYILTKLKPGVSESEIAWEIETFFHKKGAESAFSPIVAFNQNSSQPHYSPAANCELRTNNLILLDFGARVCGYCADMSRIVFLGQPAPKQKHVYETVLHAQKSVLTTLMSSFDSSNNRRENSHISIYENRRREISGAALDKLARSMIEKQNLPPYPHSLGHAVGLDIHEAPRLSLKKDEMLLPGMVVTVEPAVYLPGSFGIRIEDLVLIKENGIEVLSKSPKHFLVL